MPIKRFLAPALAALVLLGTGQSGSAANPGGAESAYQAASSQPAVRLENGSILYAELMKTVDAKKAKVGDPVSAVLVADVLAHGKIVVRHDSKLVGHVTEAQIHTKEAPESRLGIVFDKAITKGGEVPFQSVLLAIRPGDRAVVDIPNAPSPMQNSAQQPMTTNPSPQVPRIHRTIDDDTKHNRRMAETGPTDIDGLSLSSPANGGAQAIVSTKRTVKLESGIKLELRVTGQ